MENKKLEKDELLQLFDACVKSAYSLWAVAIENLKSEDTKYISLGLSELAMEELGKSYTCLSYYCLAGKRGVWKQFWTDWKNHTVKAHRAFFYEFFSLHRYQIDGYEKYVPSLRKIIPLEKEVSFYVDFNYNKKLVLKPWQEIDVTEIANRVLSVVGPINTAMKVQTLIEKNNDENYILGISKYAFNTITSEMFQQDVEKVIAQMKNGIVEHDRALNDIWNMFNTENKND